MITEAQRERRQRYLGSSDAPAILNLSPFKGAYDVYLEKTEDLNPMKNSKVLELGEYLEDSIVEWFSKTSGKKILKNQMRVHKNKIMAANFDALVVNSNEAVEVKTSGLLFKATDEWGEEETDQVPESVIIQCQHQMAVLPDIKVIWVPALLGGRGFAKFKIERNDELIKELETRELKFWQDYVLQKIPPPDSVPSLDTLKRLQRVPNKSVPLDDTLVRTWISAKEVSSKADKEKELAQRAVLAALGDAEEGVCSFGKLLYLEQEKKETIIKASKFRVARFKENKKGGTNE